MRPTHEMTEEEKEDQRRMSGEGGHDPVLPPTRREASQQGCGSDKATGGQMSASTSSKKVG